MKTLLARPITALATLLAAPRPVPHAPDTLALRLPADTLRQRPDVRAAEARVAAASAGVMQAEALRPPNFRLGGSLGLNALTIAGLGNGSAVIALLLAGVSTPLFDGGVGWRADDDSIAAAAAAPPAGPATASAAPVTRIATP